jgi:putative Mg2+ transporter-C (MgtC) family protein
MDWHLAWFNLWHLGIAYLLALPVAFDRERVNESAGLRTFPLVAIAACGYTLVGMGMLDSTDAEARVIQGVITGIGFIGGGAILKNRGSVSGLSTAASIWTTGLIGIAVATDRIEIAAILAIITFATMHLGRAVKSSITESEQE